MKMGPTILPLVTLFLAISVSVPFSTYILLSLIMFVLLLEQVLKLHETLLTDR